jgi:hypothetical protein
MIEQSVGGWLGRLVEMIGSSGLGSGAAECACGVVRRSGAGDARGASYLRGRLGTIPRL